MSIIGLMPARNEAWVLGYSARAALQWVDHLIILAHACTDDTVSIALQIQMEAIDRVTIIIEPNPNWLEADNRQRMLKVGRSLGGTIFAPVDADEVLCADRIPGIRAELEDLGPGELMSLPWIDLWRSLDRYRVDKCRTAPFAFRDRSDLHWSAGEDGYQLHMRNPKPTYWRVRDIDPSNGGVMHLQRVNFLRAQARQAKYKINEQLYFPVRRGGVKQIEERHHRAVDERVMTVTTVPSKWWANGLDRSLIDVEMEPWEVAAVRSLVHEHGRQKFVGLDLYGIA